MDPADKALLDRDDATIDDPDLLKRKMELHRNESALLKQKILEGDSPSRLPPPSDLNSIMAPRDVAQTDPVSAAINAEVSTNKNLLEEAHPRFGAGARLRGSLMDQDPEAVMKDLRARNPDMEIGMSNSGEIIGREKGEKTFKYFDSPSLEWKDIIDEIPNAVIAAASGVGGIGAGGLTLAATRNPQAAGRAGALASSAIMGAGDELKQLLGQYLYEGEGEAKLDHMRALLSAGVGAVPGIASGAASGVKAAAGKLGGLAQTAVKGGAQLIGTAMGGRTAGELAGKAAASMLPTGGKAATKKAADVSEAEYLKMFLDGDPGRAAQYAKEKGIGAATEAIVVPAELLDKLKSAGYGAGAKTTLKEALDDYMLNDKRSSRANH